MNFVLQNVHQHQSLFGIFQSVQVCISVPQNVKNIEDGYIDSKSKSIDLIQNHYHLFCFNLMVLVNYLIAHLTILHTSSTIDCSFSIFQLFCKNPRHFFTIHTFRPKNSALYFNCLFPGYPPLSPPPPTPSFFFNQLVMINSDRFACVTLSIIYWCTFLASFKPINLCNSPVLLH